MADPRPSIPSPARALLRAALILVLLFAIDAALVASGLTRGVDQAVLTALRQVDLPGVAISPAWTVRWAIAITTIGAGVVRVPATLLAALVLALRRRTRDALLLIGAVASGALAMSLLKLLFHRARPDLVWRLVVENNLSFPSGHAMGAAITYPLAGWLIGRTIGTGAARAGVIAGIALALAIGLTRIFLGVHWASDVLGGWLIGAAWACGTVALSRR